MLIIDRISNDSDLPVKRQTSLWWHMQDFSNHLVR